MAKNIFEMSSDGKSEYCINVVKIGTLSPIDGSDFLAQTFIGDASLVVRKDQVNEGDLLFYASNECQLSEKFLSANNLFEIGCYEKNSNASEVKSYLDYAAECEDIAMDKDGDEREKYLQERDEWRAKAKSKCGFFTHNGRVRMIRLKRTPSMGYLFSLDEMAKYCPKVKDINMEDYLNVDFDTVDGELFVKAYVPPMKEHGVRGEKKNKRDNKVKRFNRIIDWTFHYDTDMLAKNIWKIRPNDVVTITNKLHGTSWIAGKVKTRNPKKIAFHKRMWNKFVDTFGVFKDKRVIDYTIDYDVVYSSRGVIKNQYINENVTTGYYKFDIWKEATDLIAPYLDEDMTVYGEICGWADQSPIQKGYDYGCKQGEFFLMPYRITTKIKEGSDEKYEWNVSQVKEWTEKLIAEHPELADKVHPITIFYRGTLADLYPNVKVSEHWHENILQEMMNDKEHFGMEELEPMCNNKVPREGVVLRIENDPFRQAFKLKCLAFREREAKSIDKGEVDIEMQDAYGGFNLPESDGMTYQGHSSHNGH